MKGGRPAPPERARYAIPFYATRRAREEFASTGVISRIKAFMPLRRASLRLPPPARHARLRMAGAVAREAAGESR